MFNKKISPSNFVARGKMELDNIAIPIIVHGTYHSYEPTPVSCIVSPDGKRKKIGDFTSFDKIKIKATTNEGEEIRILGMELHTTSGVGSAILWKGNAKYFIRGQLKSFNATGSTVHCSIFIPFTPLAKTQVSYTRSYDGTITLDEKSRGKVLSGKQHLERPN